VAIRITVWIQGLFSGFVTNERYGKWLTDINLLLILIRQMVVLVRRALAEVCTMHCPSASSLFRHTAATNVKHSKLECGPMPNVMVALPNTGGAGCSTPQSLADAHYWNAMQ